MRNAAIFSPAEAIKGASVRDLERMARLKPGRAQKQTPVRDTFYNEVELSLKKALHRKVYIKPKENGKGALTLEFYSKDELAEFARKLADGEK